MTALNPTANSQTRRISALRRCDTSPLRHFAAATMPVLAPSCLSPADIHAGGLRPAPQVDPDLGAEIARIKAVDNHAHPVRRMPKGQRDRFFDALPVDNMKPASTRRR